MHAPGEAPRGHPEERTTNRHNVRASRPALPMKALKPYLGTAVVALVVIIAYGYAKKVLPASIQAMLP